MLDILIQSMAVFAGAEAADAHIAMQPELGRYATVGIPVVDDRWIAIHEIGTVKNVGGEDTIRRVGITHRIHGLILFAAFVEMGTAAAPRQMGNVAVASIQVCAPGAVGSRNGKRRSVATRAEE